MSGHPEEVARLRHEDRPPVLLADVGGTNARFALSRRPGEVSGLQRLEVAGFASFADALARYLQDAANPRLSGAALAGAGPVSEGAIALTNAPWRIEAAAVSRQIGGAPVALVNDLAAVALALPFLAPSDVLQLAGPSAPPSAVGGATEPLRRASEPPSLRLAVNIGTGFGAAGVMMGPDRVPVIIPGEAGHMRLACPVQAPDGRSIDAFDTVEDVLSGAGVRRLGRLLRGEREPGLDPPTPDAGDLDPGSRNGAQSALLGVLTPLIGRVCGDLALALGAWSGVFLCGSVATAWARAVMIEGAGGPLANSFALAFCGTSPMADRLAQVPVFLIVRPEPGLYGLSHLRPQG